MSTLKTSSNLIQDFDLTDQFSLNLSRTYNHMRQLDSFRTEFKKEFYFFHDAIANGLLNHAAEMLEPSTSYSIEIFDVRQPTTEKCLRFIANKNAVFAGAHGLSLLWELCKEKLPTKKWMVSFPRIYSVGSLGIPLLYQHGNGEWRFELGGLGNENPSTRCLVCFTPQQS